MAPLPAAPPRGWACLPFLRCLQLPCLPREPPAPPPPPPSPRRRYALPAAPRATYPYTLARRARELPATSRARRELEARLPALVSAWEAEVAETARRHHRRVRARPVEPRAHGPGDCPLPTTAPAANPLLRPARRAGAEGVPPGERSIC